MHKKISDGVDMNFNYSCLLLVACVVAALGLATDSSTTGKSALVLFYYVNSCPCAQCVKSRRYFIWPSLIFT